MNEERKARLFTNLAYAALCLLPVFYGAFGLLYAYALASMIDPQITGTNRIVIILRDMFWEHPSGVAPACLLIASTIACVHFILRAIRNERISGSE